MSSLTLLIAAAAVAGCSRSEDRYLKRPVEVEEVVGRWTLTPESAQVISNSGYSGIIDPSKLSIDVLPDGTCHFHTFMSVERSAVPVAGPVDAECTWRIDHSERQELAIRLEVKPARAAGFYFAEEQGMLLLWQFADDPDFWRYVEYRKQRP